MHQQFRPIGCAIVRGQAKLTLGRLHYVRATREEAARANHITATTGGHQANGEDHRGSTTIQWRDIQLLNNFGMDNTTACLTSRD